MQGSPTTIGYATTLGGSYTTLSGVTSITAPTFTNVKVDNTDLASTAMEYVAGTCRDNGEIEFTWKQLSTTNSLTSWLGNVDIPARYSNAAAQYWKVTFADASFFKFRGFISAITPPEGKTNVLGVWKLTITIKGAVTKG